MKPGGGAKTVSRCDIQQRLLAPAAPASRRPGSLHRQLRAAELPHLGALHVAAELAREQLHAVADAEHRDPELEQRRVESRRVGRVDRRGAAGEDQPARSAARDLGRADVVRQQLGEDAALAHAARDQLRVLAAVVEDDDLLRGRRVAARTRLRSRVPAVDRVRGRRRQRLGARRRRASAAGQSLTRATARPFEPIPTCWSRWRCLPSVCSAGATISSARLNSAMSR